MHRFISFNREIISSEQAFLPAASSAAFYGRSVFTTLAVYNAAAPFLWEKHWRRLIENAARIGIDLSEFAEEDIRARVSELIRRNKITDAARARITFFDASLSGGIWSSTLNNHKTNLLIATADTRRKTTNFLSLTVSPFRVNSSSPLAGVKSGNYLENLLALEQARRSGFDEAIRLNERDEIVSASMANVFWTKNGVLFTPPLETGCLAGTTREFILENFSVQLKKVRFDELAQADEVFLTSSGIGVAQAAKIDDHSFNTFAQLTEEIRLFLQNSIDS